MFLKAFRATRNENRVLVTGSHRSGTTWVGRILASHPELKYVLEPLNVTHGPDVVKAVNKHCYPYISRQNERHFLRPLQAVLRADCQAKDCQTAHTRHRGVLIKDPFAVFSIPWFALRLGCRSVVTVRNPVSLIGSLKRLGWRFDHRHLSEQSLLMRDRLEPYRAEMEAAAKAKDDIVGQGCLLWRMIYSVVRQIKRELPEMIILRHEDLSRDPLTEFHRLFDRLGLEVSDATDQVIHAFTNASNPKEAGIEQPHDNTTVALDSLANLDNWKHRLNESEVRRILDSTCDVASLYYSEAELDQFAAAYRPSRKLALWPRKRVTSIAA